MKLLQKRNFSRQQFKRELIYYIKCLAFKTLFLCMTTFFLTEHLPPYETYFHFNLLNDIIFNYIFRSSFKKKYIYVKIRVNRKTQQIDF